MLAGVGKEVFLLLLLFLLFWLSFPQGTCFFRRRQESCGCTDPQQIPSGNDNQKSKGV
jgi:hypothetical protein